MASWTHNMNVNVLGYSPLQLVTGKNVIFPGITTGNVATESLYDNELVRKIMERHYELMKEFRESEFSRKLNIAANTRSKGYENEVLNEGDFVFYQKSRQKGLVGTG